MNSFQLCWVFTALHGLHLAGESGGHSVFAHQLLLAVTSLVAEHRSRRVGFSGCSSRALGHRLSGCGVGLVALLAYGIFPDQGSNPCPLYWQVDSYSLYPTRDVQENLNFLRWGFSNCSVGPSSASWRRQAEGRQFGVKWYVELGFHEAEPSSHPRILPCTSLPTLRLICHEG